jgi:hypothetical protein
VRGGLEVPTLSARADAPLVAGPSRADSGLRACLKSPKGLVFNPLVKPLKFLQATTDEDSLEHFARTARQLLGREAMSFG